MSPTLNGSSAVMDQNMQDGAQRLLVCVQSGDATEREIRSVHELVYWISHLYRSISSQDWPKQLLFMIEIKFGQCYLTVWAQCLKCNRCCVLWTCGWFAYGQLSQLIGWWQELDASQCKALWWIGGLSYNFRVPLLIELNGWIPKMEALHTSVFSFV